LIPVTVLQKPWVQVMLVDAKTTLILRREQVVVGDLPTRGPTMFGMSAAILAG